jgi:hypothetical protein
MQIFISYSRVDREFAQKLVQDLKNNGYTVWFDLESIPHGANWDNEVQRGLEDSDTMLVLLSPTSSASQNVADEWHFFLSKNKRLIPLMIAPNEVPFRLSRRQRVDFVKKPYEQAFEELLLALGEPAFGYADGTRPADASSKSLPVSWADDYHWWLGLVPNAANGEATISRSELRFVAPDRLPLLIPLNRVVSAELKHSPWDRWVQVTFKDKSDQLHTLAVMGTERARRKAVQNELVGLINTSAGIDD